MQTGGKFESRGNLSEILILWDPWDAQKLTKSLDLMRQSFNHYISLGLTWWVGVYNKLPCYIYIDICSLSFQSFNSLKFEH